MRIPMLFVMAFLSGVHGFAIFAPYMLLVLLIAYLVRVARRTTRELKAPRLDLEPLVHSVSMGSFAAA